MSVGIIGEALFAPVSMVIQEYLGLLPDGTMLAELFGSLQQMLVGFALACVVGMPLGIAMGRSQVCDVIFHPWLSMCVVISVAALVPLFLLLFGSGFAFLAAIVFMASAWYFSDHPPARLLLEQETQPMADHGLCIADQNVQKPVCHIKTPVTSN